MFNLYNHNINIFITPIQTRIKSIIINNYTSKCTYSQIKMNQIEFVNTHLFIRILIRIPCIKSLTTHIVVSKL